VGKYGAPQNPFQDTDKMKTKGSAIPKINTLFIFLPWIFLPNSPLNAPSARTGSAARKRWPTHAGEKAVEQERHKSHQGVAIHC
jgi:hypothetical protein